MNEISSLACPRSCAATSSLSHWGALCRRHAGIAAVMAFAAWYLSPILWSDFSSDDLSSSCIAGNLIVHECSLPELIGTDVRQELTAGRFCPLGSAIRLTIPFIFRTLIAYKGALIALSLANILLFYGLLRRWNVSRPLAQLGTLSVVLLCQLRLTADPLFALGGAVQFATAFWIVSLLCQQRHVQTGKSQLADGQPRAVCLCTAD